MIESQGFLFTKLNEIRNVKTSIYQGELAEFSQTLVIANKAPLILIDFIGDRGLLNLESELEFSIYIVNVTQSINTESRNSSRDDTLELIDTVDKKLSMTQTDQGGVVRLGGLKKVFDSKSQKGYMTIFIRQVFVTKVRHHHILEEEN
jgi:hypothetical protein